MKFVIQDSFKPRYDNSLHCHTEVQNSYDIINHCHTKLFHQPRSKPRYDNPLDCHTEVLNPYDINRLCHTSYFIFPSRYTHIHAPYSTRFSSFFHKNLLVTRFQARFCLLVSNPSISKLLLCPILFWSNRVRPSHWVRPSCPFLNEFERFSADSVILWPCIISIDRFSPISSRLSLKP